MLGRLWWGNCRLEARVGSEAKPCFTKLIIKTLCEHGQLVLLLLISFLGSFKQKNNQEKTGLVSSIHITGRSEKKRREKRVILEH